MKLSLFAVATAILATAEAATYQFNVVSPNSDTVQVNVDGTLTALKAPYPNVPFYTAIVDVGSASTYSYVANNKAESFSRELDTSTNKTYNEFYDRPITYANIPELPRPLDNGKQWTRADENPDLFDINYIPSIFVHGDKHDMDTLAKDVPSDTYTVELTFVAKDYVKTFSGVSLSISGAGKRHNPAKQSWRWYLSPGDYINNRNMFKIRHMEEDPTQMREMLYADCLRSIGTYGNRANLVRYFINGRGYGTFNMLEEVNLPSYIGANFYAGKHSDQIGPLFDGASGANFDYSPSGDYYSFIPNPDSSYDASYINEIAQPFSELDIKNTAAINNFQSIFDLDQYLRFMVMEYLTGSWDGYWGPYVTNDGAYKDILNGNTWYYLGQDFDGTFGVNMAEDLLKVPYSEYHSKYKDSVLVNKLLQNPDYAATFASYVQDTVKVLFNNDTLGAHIMAYHEFIASDIKWDRSIKQVSPGSNYGWSYEDTYKNIFEGVLAPNVNANNGGGAQYGLTEWIYEKSKFVASELNFSLDSNM